MSARHLATVEDILCETVHDRPAQHDERKESADAVV